MVPVSPIPVPLAPAVPVFLTYDGPNEALIISGVFHGNEPTMIVGGRALVFPMVQTIQKLPLSTMTLVVQSPKVYTSQGVPISVTGVAQVSKQPAYLNIKQGLRNA